MNIFENAGWGDLFKLRNGKEAVYLGFDGGHYACTSEGIMLYDEDGTMVDGFEGEDNEFDIVECLKIYENNSEWKH